MLITFSGLDGAGKSTLIDWLRATLEGHNRRVVVYHMNDHVGVYAYLRAVRDLAMRGLGRAALAGSVDGASRPMIGPAAVPARPARETFIRKVRDRIVWSNTLRRVVYVADLLVFAAYRLYVERLRGRVLIMDRYFYDTLVDVYDPRHVRWLRALELLTPTPDVPVYLEVSPETSFARKGEYDVEYLRRRHAAYHAVFPWISSSVSLCNDNLEATQEALREVVLSRLRLGSA